MRKTVGNRVMRIQKNLRYVHHDIFTPALSGSSSSSAPTGGPAAYARVSKVLLYLATEKSRTNEEIRHPNVAPQLL